METHHRQVMLETCDQRMSFAAQEAGSWKRVKYGLIMVNLSRVSWLMKLKTQQSWVNLDIWKVQPLEKNGILVENHYLETR